MPVGLTLRELEAATRLGATVLLALDHARIAGEEAVGLQPLAQIRLEQRQRARDAVAQRAGLRRDAAAVQLRDHVHARLVADRLERLADVALERGPREEVVERLAVDDVLASAGLERHGTVRRREDFEIAMDEVMMSIVPQLEKRTPYTALFANLATLMGLLGTIMGLIHAFEAVATAAPSEKAALLTASISEAMSCTALGLMVAMPMLAANLFLNMKAGTIIDSLEVASLKTVNAIASFNAKNRN